MRALRRGAFGAITMATAALASPPTHAGVTSLLASEAPDPGRYDAQLCVATGAAAPSCGLAEAELSRGGKLRVQISDIAYRIQLRPGHVDVVLVQGSMQLDEFSAPCAWLGQSLRFADVDKGARYEVKLGARQDMPK